MAQLGIIPGLCDSKAHSLPITPCRFLIEYKSMGWVLERAIIANSYGIYSLRTYLTSQNNQAELVYCDPMFQKEKPRLTEDK